MRGRCVATRLTTVGHTGQWTLASLPRKHCPPGAAFLIPPSQNALYSGVAEVKLTASVTVLLFRVSIAVPLAEL